MILNWLYLNFSKLYCILLKPWFLCYDNFNYLRFLNKLLYSSPFFLFALGTGLSCATAHHKPARDKSVENEVVDAVMFFLFEFSIV
jgi:hypothetical protein